MVIQTHVWLGRSVRIIGRRYIVWSYLDKQNPNLLMSTVLVSMALNSIVLK